MVVVASAVVLVVELSALHHVARCWPVWSSSMWSCYLTLDSLRKEFDFVECSEQHENMAQMCDILWECVCVCVCVCVCMCVHVCISLSLPLSFSLWLSFCLSMSQYVYRLSVNRLFTVRVIRLSVYLSVCPSSLSLSLSLPPLSLSLSLSLTLFFICHVAF